MRLTGANVKTARAGVVGGRVAGTGVAWPEMIYIHVLSKGAMTPGALSMKSNKPLHTDGSFVHSAHYTAAG